MREQITPWFSLGAVGGMQPLVQALAGELLDCAAGASGFDVAIDYAIPVASLTMLRLLGFAPSRHKAWPPGERVLIAYGSANRDPAVFTDPDDLDLQCSNNRHLAFGAGIHRCLGRHLARMELRVAIRELLDRFPTFEVTGTVIRGFGENRGIRSLPVLTKPSLNQPD